MKILVISNSNGCRQELKNVLSVEEYDRVIFLGNSCSDIESLDYNFAFPPLIVKGKNEILHKKPIEIRTKICGLIFHICNGFSYNTKEYGCLKLIEYATNNLIDIVVFGDDDKVTTKRVGRTYFLNPGSFGITHDGKRTYAILSINNGVVSAKIKNYVT